MKLKFKKKKRRTRTRNEEGTFDGKEYVGCISIEEKEESIIVKQRFRDWTTEE